ncbi:biotin--[acetyl-CoA-carboxylase] ligase [Fibrobacter sp.]|uniref:biotin--[acetyl-CoA-carboxylase] ligase n=1 Tax=Fibrobacter sp. TaxID=35828 RepID=UPI002636FEFB|nr:biotin--[acetyl-CoA-carboxylase] ligase [Fibrobacter sp.]MDD7497893.1 biotin--[acetyl-CoA-carboxylase] ligase [Fibrobacter sp.]MDY5723835.1 biotin--[acetyl-CoA-carboxylase] ligase [Fibrobacter sp.]
MFSPERPFCDWHLGGFGNAPAFLFDSLESTHSLMKARAAAGDIAPGTLMVADTQTAGRGRHERTWDSPAGLNLYFNILISLDGIPLASAPQITQVAALTFAEIFKGLQDDAHAQGLGNPNIGNVSVKWPNDILCGKHKFCGILAELVYIKKSKSDGAQYSTAAKNIPAISMGVGINVNSSPDDYAHLGRSVTTLKDICGQRINREKLLQMLVANLERAVGQFRAFGIRPWVAAWKLMDQFIGARGTIVVNNHCTDQNRDSGEGAIKKTGSILDMRDDGSLLFKCDDGSIETVYSADLEI